MYKYFKEVSILTTDKNFTFDKLPYGNYVPYQARDKRFSNRVENFFSEKDTGDIDLESLDQEFGRELSSAIMFLGWEAKSALMGQFIKLGFDSYETGHHFIEILEHLILERHSSDDKSQDYISWVNGFDKSRRLVIINFIILMRLDFLDMYCGTMFKKDFSQWIQ